MTKKDFAFIAKLLRDSKPVYELAGTTAVNDYAHIDQWETTVSRCAIGLKRAYPRFDVQKFLKTCGYPKNNGGAK